MAFQKVNWLRAIAFEHEQEWGRVLVGCARNPGQHQPERAEISVALNPRHWSLLEQGTPESDCRHEARACQ